MTDPLRERLDMALKQLGDIRYEVQQAEQQWGAIVPADQWEQLSLKIRKMGEAALRAVPAGEAADTALVTIAACSGCGRGAVRIHHDGVACLACGSPVYLLPTPERADDSPADRQRWMRIVAGRAAPEAK